MLESVRTEICNQIFTGLRNVDPMLYEPSGSVGVFRSAPDNICVAVEQYNPVRLFRNLTTMA